MEPVKAEYLAEIGRQIAFLSAFLGGFAASFLSILLQPQNPRRYVGWAAGAAAISSASFILAVISGTAVALVLSESGLFLGRSRIARGIIRIKPFEKCRRGWIEPELARLLDKKIALCRVVVERGIAHLLNPLLLFRFRFRTPVSVDPFGHVFVAFSFGHCRFEFIADDSLPAKKHVIERTIEMVFANVSSEQRAALVQRASQNDVTAHLCVWTSRRFLREILSVNLHFLRFHHKSIGAERPNARKIQVGGT